ncbi:MAG: cell division protein ZapA [Cytophagales bacterium]
MEEVSVKVRLGKKDITLKVGKGDEEVIISAAKTLNDRIDSYQKTYPNLEREDILSMVAFDCLIDMFRAKEYAETYDIKFSEILNRENEKLKNLLAS